MKPYISARHVSVRYPNQSELALADVSFELAKEKIMVVIGPNGSGKSTLLKAMVGTLSYQGNIDIGAEDEPAHSHGTPIGYVAQRFSIDQQVPVTVAEFVGLALATCSHSTTQQQQLVASSLHKVGLARKEQTLVSNLSGGQVQRLLLARALVHQPELLILDEPEAGVDAAGEQSFYEVLSELVKTEKMTVIIASHELELVRNYADEVLCLNKQVVCFGRPETVMTAATFKKLYGQGFGVFHHHHEEEHHA